MVDSENRCHVNAFDFSSSWGLLSVDIQEGLWDEMGSGAIDKDSRREGRRVCVQVGSTQQWYLNISLFLFSAALEVYPLYVFLAPDGRSSWEKLLL